MNSAGAPQAQPSPGFVRSVTANLAYWHSRTESQDESNLACLDPERQNIFRAVQYGLMVPDAWPVTADVAVQATSFMSQRMLLPEWIVVLERLLEAGPNDDLDRRFKLLIKIGKAHRANFHLSAAEGAFERAESTARELNDRNMLAEAAYNLSFNYLRMRRYPEAEQYGRQVLELQEDYDGAKPRLVAEAHRTLGEAAGKQGDLGKAEAYLRKAVAMWRDMGRPAYLARNMDALANILRHAGKFDEAIALYEEAVRLLEPTNDTLDKALLQINLGVLYFNMDDLKASELAFRRADTNWLRRSDNWNYQATATFNLGNVLLAQKRWDEAEPLLRRAIKLQEQMEDEVALANAIGALGECLAGRGEKAAAEAQFDAAIALLEKYPDDVKAGRLSEFFRGERAKLLREQKEGDTPQD
jgi:tetratricopeptide (TPR) repeat protein